MCSAGGMTGRRRSRCTRSCALEFTLTGLAIVVKRGYGYAILIHILPAWATRSAVRHIANCLGYHRLVKRPQPLSGVVDLSLGGGRPSCVREGSVTSAQYRRVKSKAEDQRPAGH